MSEELNKVHSDVVAWDEWKRSAEGQGCLAGSSSGAYLENRLWRAFMAARHEGKPWTGGAKLNGSIRSNHIGENLSKGAELESE